MLKSPLRITICLCTITIATQLHEGDAAYFPTFDYSTGSLSQAENASEGEGDERGKRAATSLNNRLWPGGVIYYVISHLYRGILETVLSWLRHANSAVN